MAHHRKSHLVLEYCGTLFPRCAFDSRGFNSRGVTPMKVFDRPTDMRPKHSFSMYVPNDAPTWMTGIVILAAIIMGTFMFEDSGTHQSVAPAPTQEITQPPPVNPAPPPEPAKP
jgi:hypothetical protein